MRRQFGKETIIDFGVEGKTKQTVTVIFSVTTTVQQSCKKRFDLPRAYLSHLKCSKDVKSQLGLSLKILVFEVVPNEF